VIHLCTLRVSTVLWHHFFQSFGFHSRWMQTISKKPTGVGAVNISLYFLKADLVWGFIYNWVISLYKLQNKNVISPQLYKQINIHRHLLALNDAMIGRNCLSVLEEITMTTRRLRYLLEADEEGEFSEASSADDHIVFSDDTLSGVANSASSGVFTVVSGVNSE